LLETIEKLQRTVRDLQEGTHPASETNGNTEQTPFVASEKGDHSAVIEDSEKAERISSLMGKGNTLLNLGQAEAALDCYQEVLSIDSESTDALVKKGKALESLRRMEEAIESYDRALMVDGSLTIAHLGKGGVLNRMERYSEALECYERAMQSQQKTAAAGQT
jgi:tetratricopeptide (TPR) repeat protein